jgi:UDP-N-acetylglucosamine 3-dehydrogenase
MLRVGIIGAGAIGRAHALRWKKLPVDLAGYYDAAEGSSARMAAELGGKVFSSAAELFGAVDVVDICAPTTTHRDFVIAAAQAGIPVICEKPMARTLRDCDAMIEACERYNVPLFIGQVVRFFPEYVRAREVVASGAIGKPGVIRTYRGGPYPRPAGVASFYDDFAQSGGVILDVSIHDLDYVRWTCGEVERVFARGLTFAGVSRRDHALITLRLASGAIGHIEGTWAAPRGRFRTGLEIAGNGGLLEWDSTWPGPYATEFFDPDDPDKAIRTTLSPLADEDEPYTAQLAHFLHCIETGSTPRVTPEDGRMAVKMALAAIESLRIGAPVHVPTFAEVAQ